MLTINGIDELKAHAGDDASQLLSIHSNSALARDNTLAHSLSLRREWRATERGSSAMRRTAPAVRSTAKRDVVVPGPRSALPPHTARTSSTRPATDVAARLGVSRIHANPTRATIPATLAGRRDALAR